MPLCSIISQKIDPRICGCWKPLCNETIIYKKTGEIVNLKNSETDDIREIYIYGNGTGEIKSPFRIEKFEWDIKNRKLIYHENDSCPWRDTLKYMISYGLKDDTLKIEQIYKRRTYRTISSYLREKIKIYPLNDAPETTLQNTDSYFAYRNRIILDQKPKVTRGYFEEKTGSLYLEFPIYCMIEKATKYDYIELFVFGNTYNNKNIIYSFFIEYDPITDKIKNICKTNKYKINRWYDK